MALVHVTAVRNTLTDAVVDAIDVGAGSNGTLEFQTSGDVEVATLNFAATAFGAASGGTATAAAIADDTNATGGTIAKFVIKDADGSEVYRGTVTATSGGGDIELSSLAITAGDTVSLTSLTYSASA